MFSPFLLFFRMSLILSIPIVCDCGSVLNLKQMSRARVPQIDSVQASIEIAWIYAKPLRDALHGILPNGYAGTANWSEDAEKKMMFDLGKAKLVCHWMLALFTI